MPRPRKSSCPPYSANRALPLTSFGMLLSAMELPDVGESPRSGWRKGDMHRSDVPQAFVVLRNDRMVSHIRRTGFKQHLVVTTSGLRITAHGWSSCQKRPGSEGLLHRRLRQVGALSRDAIRWKLRAGAVRLRRRSERPSSGTLDERRRGIVDTSAVSGAAAFFMTACRHRHRASATHAFSSDNRDVHSPARVLGVEGDTHTSATVRHVSPRRCRSHPLNLEAGPT